MNKINSNSIISCVLLSILVLTGVATSYAGASNKSGNPFGNGSFYETGGVFNGVMRGVNLLGITQFTTQNGTNNEVSYQPGQLQLFNASNGSYDDNYHVYAQLDPSAGTIIAMIQPSATTGTDGGYFSANLKSTPPNQTYSGSGVIPDIVGSSTNMIPFCINGTRIGNN